MGSNVLFVSTVLKSHREQNGKVQNDLRISAMKINQVWKSLKERQQFSWPKFWEVMEEEENIGEIAMFLIKGTTLAIIFNLKG